MPYGSDPDVIHERLANADPKIRMQDLAAANSAAGHPEDPGPHEEGGVFKDTPVLNWLPTWLGGGKHVDKAGDEELLGNYEPAQRIPGGGPLGSAEFIPPGRASPGRANMGPYGSADFSVSSAGMNVNNKAYIQMANRGYDNPALNSVPEMAPGGAPTTPPPPAHLTGGNRGGMYDSRAPRMGS